MVAHSLVALAADSRSRDRGFESQTGCCVFMSKKTPKLYAALAEGGGGFLLPLSPQLPLTLSFCIWQLAYDELVSRPSGKLYTDETGNQLYEPGIAKKEQTIHTYMCACACALDALDVICINTL